jgi:hypothetical protein
MASLRRILLLALGAALGACGAPLPSGWDFDFGLDGDRGAIALNKGDMVGAIAYRHLSEESADEAALKLCGKGCAVVLRFGGDTCAALASSADKQIGLGTGATQSAADAAAMAQCQARTAEACAVRLQGCNDS